MSDYNFADFKLEQNTAVYTPITFEEIVIIMIKRGFEQEMGKVRWEQVEGQSGCIDLQ